MEDKKDIIMAEMIADDIFNDAKNGDLFAGNNQKLIKGMLFDVEKKKEQIKKKIKKCECPNCENATIKKSHTIPKKMCMEIIQENRVILSPVFVKGFPTKDRFIEMKKVGIHQASTFPGFCKNHERLFESYEKERKINAVTDLIKQTYRNICFNCFKYEQLVFQGRSILERYSYVRNKSAYDKVKERYNNISVKEIRITGDDVYSNRLKSLLDNNNQFLQELVEFRSELWKEIEREQSNLTVISSEIDIVFPVCVCGCTKIEYKEEWYICALDVLISDNKTSVAVTFKENIPYNLRILIEQKLSNPINILNLIESMMIYGTDNWYLKPSIWEAISEKRKNAILKEIQNLDKSFLEEVQYSIFDDIRKYILKEIEPEQVIVEKEMKKIEEAED